ncbi:RNA helicase [Bachmanniomyces sp. S44760]|nr:RNA helicase [Bachmanniomyces sp. S44760]
MAQMQRRAPSRMTLSPKVSRSAGKVDAKGKPVRKSRNSPFGGMNMRSAQVTRAPDERSQSAQKRQKKSWKDLPRKERDPTQFKALKMQRSLTPVTYKQRTAVKEKIVDIDSFEQFNLLPSIQEAIRTHALKGLDQLVPTPIQRIAIPAMLGQDLGRRKKNRFTTISKDANQFLLAAETGSGKTLAYLLPVIDAIKRAEAEDVEILPRPAAQDAEKAKPNPYAIEPPPITGQPHSTTGRPRAIILLPTSELVEQVGGLVKSLSHTVKFRAKLTSSAYTGKVIRNRLFSPNGIDVLITTPWLLASIADSDPNVLSRVTHLVIDEADSLLDRSFAPKTSAIIDRVTPSMRQLILCSATIPRSLDHFLNARFPDLQRLVTPNLHAIPRRVQLGVVEVTKDPYHNNKNLACADVIMAIGKAAAEHALGHTADPAAAEIPTDIKRILVFVNEREKTEEVAGYLQSKGIDAVALTRDTPGQRQSDSVLESFTSLTIEPRPQKSPEHDETRGGKPEMHNFVPFAPDAPDVTPPSSLPAPPTPLPVPTNRLPNTKVLVTTDISSRGVDTVAVRHVILYDVPHSTIDFIHRLGRTGRMGRRGRGIVLVGRSDRADVVREVREGMYRGSALI